MADIDQQLNAIMNATYGREVRSSIHDAIEAINDDVHDFVRNNMDTVLTSPTLPAQGKAVGTRIKSIEDKHDQDLDQMSAAVSAIRADVDRLNAGGLVLEDGVIADNVKSWLDQHPDATTTVADGCITPKKFAPSAIDSELDTSGAAADAMAVGDAIRRLEKGADIIFPSLFLDLDAAYDVSIIRTDTGKVILIDIGRFADIDAIEGMLAMYQIEHIDYFIISHYHYDHIGNKGAGAIALINSDYISSATTVVLPHSRINYDAFVGKDIINPYTQYEAPGVNIRNAAGEKGCTILEPTVEGQTVTIEKDVSCSFYNVNPELFDNYYNITYNESLTDTGRTNYNNFSMVALLQIGDIKCLFTGDIEEAAETAICDSLSNVDVYKIEHHGSNNRVDPRFLKKMNPKIAVAINSSASWMKSSSFANPMLSKFRDNGTETYITWSSGTTIVHVKGAHVLSESEHGVWSYSGTMQSGGEYIVAGSDLNDFNEPGTYISRSATISGSLRNTPYTKSGFKLIVEQLNGSYRRQHIIANEGGVNDEYTRLLGPDGPDNGFYRAEKIPPLYEASNAEELDAFFEMLKQLAGLHDIATKVSGMLRVTFAGSALGVAFNNATSSEFYASYDAMFSPSGGYGEVEFRSYLTPVIVYRKIYQSTWRDYTRGSNDFYYTPGESVTLTAFPVYGFVSNGGKTFNLTVPLLKNTSQVSKNITLSAISGGVYGVSGEVGSTFKSDWLSHVSTASAYRVGTNVKIIMNFADAPEHSTNFTPITMAFTGTITFS